MNERKQKKNERKPLEFTLINERIFRRTKRKHSIHKCNDRRADDENLYFGKERRSRMRERKGALMMKT